MADKKNIVLAIVTSSLVLLGNSVQADEEPTHQAQEEALSYSDLGSAEEVSSDLVSGTGKPAPMKREKADSDSGSGKKAGDGKCGGSDCGKGKGEPNFPVPETSAPGPVPMTPRKAK